MDIDASYHKGVGNLKPAQVAREFVFGVHNCSLKPQRLQ